MTSPRGEDMVVLLDEEGRGVGTAVKAAVHGSDTPLHLAFSCYVFDDSGRLLLTQRAHHKRTWPGAWTNSVCGHPAPGEDLAGAVRRRTREELGLVLREVRLLLPAFRYRAVMDDGTVENEMCPVFVALTDGVVAPDVDEVAAVEWHSWGTVRDEILTGRREVSPWCLQQVQALPADPVNSPAATADLLPAAARPASALEPPSLTRRLPSGPNTVGRGASRRPSGPQSQ